MTRSGGGAALVALVGLVALGLAGCGGGGAPPKNASPGLRVFDNATCASCHTLAAANASGTAGPKLDGRSLDAATVERFVRDGGSGMPPFKDQLSDTEIQQVADYVAKASQQ
jgi:sulfite dehydrogenase